MYVPSHFEETRGEVLRPLMQAHPLATLVVPGGAELAVSHIPLLFDPAQGPHGSLRGHVARANPLWRQLGGPVGCVAIFQGPQAYVTPSWYQGKHEHGKVVPTWNYAVVHAAGTLTPLHASDDKERVLKMLIDAHDAPYRARWDELDAEWREKMKSGIVAFAIDVARLDVKFKVSQNRSAADRAGVLGALEQGDASARALAEWTRRVSPAP